MWREVFKLDKLEIAKELTIASISRIHVHGSVDDPAETSERYVEQVAKAFRRFYEVAKELERGQSPPVNIGRA